MAKVNVVDRYEDFIMAKRIPGVIFTPDGHAIIPDESHVDEFKSTIAFAEHLHEYQRFCCAFALAKKRSALFLECGLGKTSISIAWALAIGGPVAICAPLAACYEYIDEAVKFFPDANIHLLRGNNIDSWLESPSGIGIFTHHAMINGRDLDKCRGIVLDESSILKSGNGAIAIGSKDSVSQLEYRLALSATPAPNDPTEFASHATWLGYVKTDAEFRAMFFVRDGKFWRLKRHAESMMPRWLAAWAIWMRDPATYGMPCDSAMPDTMQIEIKRIESDPNVEIERDLFGSASGSISMSDRANLRRALWSDTTRMKAVIDEVTNGIPSIVWGKSNAHCDAMEKTIRQSGVSVAQLAGRTPEDERVDILNRYRDGSIDCIVSKPSVIGHGVNLQRAGVMVFAGYDESYEAQHQAIRRAHRQGRIGPLRVVWIVSPDEEKIIDTLNRKSMLWEIQATKQEEEMMKNIKPEIERFKEGKKISDNEDRSSIRRCPIENKWYRIYNGDCVQVMRDLMDEESVDLSVFSPPFSSLFTYSSEPEDMGNCSGHDGDVEFNIHFKHFAKELMRVMKTGRVVCLHLSQLVAFRANHGRKGLRDFRGTVIKSMEDAGFHYYGEFVIPKNPQAAAIRTKSERLQFSQFKRDSLESSPCLNDYMLEFRKPGRQKDRVKNDISNEEWIRWASGIWSDISETDVLSGWMAARSDKDEKHICPLQLEVIRRCIRLWTNKGDVVFSPFAGIGSEVYVAIEQDRFGIGIELKPEYFDQAHKNADLAVTKFHLQKKLF